MKFRLVILFMSLLSMTLSAQTLVEFKLQKDGSFISEDGKSFVVVPCEGKTAQELYTIVKSNVMTLYNSPKNVMSENEPNDLSIRALSSTLEESMKFMQGIVNYKAYYNLVFHFKDGRIKVDAPTVSRDLVVESTGSAFPKTFDDFVKGWFEKSGEAKKKKLKDIQKIESIFNFPINYLLGNFKSNNQQEEDW